MYFSVPLDMTAIEKRAYYHLVNGHWLRKNRVFMVESPIADAIAMGIDLKKSGKHDRKHRCTEYSVFHHNRRQDHH